MNQLEVYLKDLNSALAKGNATEHTHRTAFKIFIESLGKGLTATNEPRHIACGAPDFILTKGHTPLGYVETKDIGVALDREEKSNQMARYLGSLGNLVLTDYLEFRWYVQGRKRMTARLASPGPKGKLVVDSAGAEAVQQLLKAFLQCETPTLRSPKDLAARMASIALLIRDIIQRAFDSEEGGGSLHEQMRGFQDVLLHDLEPPQFADMYAQTICYGMFAARCVQQDTDVFTRIQAPHLLPKTNPFLRKLFGHIAGPDLDGRIVWAVDDLAELLNKTAIQEILKDFGKRTRQEDPVVHFYETFLAAYDPKLRESRGVYYTPEPVVSYIVRSVDHILRTQFGMKDGLGDSSKVALPQSDGTTKQVHKVQILDPATGTGTFLHGVIDTIHDSFKGNQGLWSSYVSEHLLPRIFGFELLMAPYAVAHLKLGLQLAETGYDFHSDERLRIYLTNTLEEAFDHPDALPYFSAWIAEEAREAGKVKREAPVMVVLGNPPYSGHSANKGEWIAKLLKGVDVMDPHHPKATGNYFEVDGKPLGERNPKWLNDDYVKFIRFAQWRIEQTGHGVLAFISNHGYLDNPTFRGMRQSLMQTFDEIFVLDLHGNSKKRETSPDGSKDENVFDIQQGVAIGLFVKRGGASAGNAKVHHAHLWGDRDSKYAWLSNHGLAETAWTDLASTSPAYLFVSQNQGLWSEYEQGWDMTKAMPVNVLGFQTHRDNFAVDSSEDALRERMSAFRETALDDSEIKARYELKDSTEWSVNEARKQIRSDAHWNTHFVQCHYRPFDTRWCYFDTVAMDRPRRELLDHVAGKANHCLGIGRQVFQGPFRHVVVSKYPIEGNGTQPANGLNVFPLYLYPSSAPGQLIETYGDSSGQGGRRPNLSPDFIADFSAHLKLTFVPDGHGDLKKTFGPEDVFAYAYAIFHAPSYRSRYAEFLKTDFPRLPLTSDLPLFRKLCALGQELGGLHLMEREGAAPARFPINGNNVVEKLCFEPGVDGGRVWINGTQYFADVPEAVWSFHVGGYQVCEKWLKDRKGRTLSFEDLRHYQSIVAALGDTIRLMAEIDQAIETHGGWPLA